MAEGDNESSTSKTLRQIAEALTAEAIPVELTGDPQHSVRRPLPPNAAQEPGDIAIAIEPTALAGLDKCRAGAAMVTAGASPPAGSPANLLRVGAPRHALAVLLRLFEPAVHARPGVDPSAVVDASATLGTGVSIGPLVTIGPGAAIGDGTILMAQVSIGAAARIGRGCLLHPGVRIGERVTLGERNILQHNASIGADGFGYATPEIGAKTAGSRRAIMRIASLGTVALGDDVEVGACTAIDRGTLGATRIGRGTKIDNLVMIGHNTAVGEDCLICGRVGISGSCRIGNRVVLAGGVGIADHVDIGDDAVVMAGSGVAGDVAAGTVVGGVPALPRDQFLQEQVHLRRLKRMFGDLLDLQQRVKELEAERGRDTAS